MSQANAMASSLIGTRSLPPGLARVREMSREARAYHRLDAYPLYHFRDWKSEDRGPLPRCLPIAKSIVRRGARWLFGEPPIIHCGGNPKLELLLRESWKQNRMPSRLVAAAEEGALDGGVVLKFSYDTSEQVPLSFQTLSLVDEVRLYYSPHDCRQMLMARVQYPYFDAVDGKTYWYREEWTDEEEVHYAPVAAEQILGARAGNPAAVGGETLVAEDSADSYQGWQISSRQANPFGMIPLMAIKNIETDDLWGAGDLWDLFRVLDRVHLTYHLMDKSNQFDSEMAPMFIDLDVDEQDADRPLQPGQPLDLKSDSMGEQRQGRVVFPPTGNGLRPAMMDYARDLRKQILEAAGSVFVDQAEFSNKGNLTNAVLEQLYWPQIQATREKRKNYGDYGLAPFLEMAAVALSRARLIDCGVDTTDEATYAVTLQWPPYFDLSPDERAASLTTVQEAEQAAYLTHERAVDLAAPLFGITDVKALQSELKRQPPPPPAPDPVADQEEQNLQDIRRIGGRDSQ